MDSMKRITPHQWNAVIFWSVCVMFSGLTFSSAVVEIAFAVSLSSFVFLCLREKRTPLANVPWQVKAPLAAYLGVVVFSCVLSEYPAQSVRGILKVLQQVSIFTLASEIFACQKRLSLFERILALLFTLTVANGFFQYFTGSDFIRGFVGEHSSAGIRVSGSFKTYGLFAAFMILTLPYFVTLTFRRKLGWPLRTGMLLVGLGALVLVFLTRSRGAILSFLLAACLWVLFSRKIALMAALFVGIAGVIVVLPHSMIIHLDQQGKEQSLVERYYLWDRAVHVIRAKPWTGTGINTYARAHPKYDKTQNWRVRNYYAHNGYLQMAAEIGLIGLASFVLFLFFSIRYVLSRLKKIPEDENRRILSGLLMGMTAFLAMALVDTVLHNGLAVMTFWFILGLQYAYLRTPGPFEENKPSQ